MRWFRGIWRDASFSLKFAAVILVAGAAIAVVPLMLAEASARAQAESSAADRVSIAASLVDGQRASLAVFIAGVGRQLAANHDVNTPSAVQATLAADGSVIGSDDVLGVVRTDGAVIAVQGTTPTASALTNGIVSAATAGIDHRCNARWSRLARGRVADPGDDRDRVRGSTAGHDARQRPGAQHRDDRGSGWHPPHPL